MLSVGTVRPVYEAIMKDIRPFTVLGLIEDLKYYSHPKKSRHIRIIDKIEMNAYNKSKNVTTSCLDNSSIESYISFMTDRIYEAGLIRQLLNHPVNEQRYNQLWSLA